MELLFLAKVGVASSSLVFRSRKPSEFSGGFFVPMPEEPRTCLQKKDQSFP